MASSNRSIRFACVSNSLPQRASVTFPQTISENVAAQPRLRREFSFRTVSRSRPKATSFAGPRCSEKGCVFPAASSQTMKCAYHERQMEEPILFSSQQPSRLLLDPARISPEGEEYDESRKRDRRRLAKQWEEFLKDSGA
jgi:hypothetical protein